MSLSSTDGILDSVSVPLRGYGFEIIGAMDELVNTGVSVPLRGYGFEIFRVIFLMSSI